MFMEVFGRACLNRVVLWIASQSNVVCMASNEGSDLNLVLGLASGLEKGCMLISPS